MATKDITVIVKTKGRKYFSAIIGGYKAKIVINPVSSDIPLDTIVKMSANDLSTRTNYGTDIVFEPVEIYSHVDARPLRDAAIKRREAEKWVGYAESDAERGLHRTNAAHKARELAAAHPELSDRIAKLDQMRKQQDLDDAAERKRQAFERAQAWEQKRMSEQAQSPRRITTLFPDALARWPDGAIIDYKGRNCKVAAGPAHRIDENDPSIYGSHLLGYEGDMAHYYYLTPCEDNGNA